MRRVAVAEVEPDVLAHLAQRVHHRERVAAQAPAAAVDLVGSQNVIRSGSGET
jgi:hypothetical protein